MLLVSCRGNKGRCWLLLLWRVVRGDLESGYNVVGSYYRKRANNCVNITNVNIVMSVMLSKRGNDFLSRTRWRIGWGRR
jgi:hypothetical protein